MRLVRMVRCDVQRHAAPKLRHKRDEASGGGFGIRWRYPPSAMCGANASHLIVPVIAAPSALLASTVNTPPLPAGARVTVPEPATVPPRTVLTLHG